MNIKNMYVNTYDDKKWVEAKYVTEMITEIHNMSEFLKQENLADKYNKQRVTK